MKGDFGLQYLTISRSSSNKIIAFALPKELKNALSWQIHGQKKLVDSSLSRLCGEVWVSIFWQFLAVECFRELLWITGYLLCLDVGLNTVQQKCKKGGHSLDAASTISVLIW